MIRFAHTIDVRRDDDLLTVAEFAALHGMPESSVNRLLRADAELPASQRRLPGAYKAPGQNKFRAEWYIPRSEAEAFVKHRPGRKPGTAAPMPLATQMDDDALLMDGRAIALINVDHLSLSERDTALRRWQRTIGLLYTRIDTLEDELQKATSDE